MKYLRCDKCNYFNFIPNYFQAIGSCECGNISGRYLIDNECAIIYLKNQDSLLTSRVVGVPNEVVYGQKLSAKCGIGDWKTDKQLLVFVGAEIYSENLLETNEPRLHAIKCMLDYLISIKKEVDLERRLCTLLFEIYNKNKIELEGDQ
jgi:hypothetical protein